MAVMDGSTSFVCPVVNAWARASDGVGSVVSF